MKTPFTVLTLTLFLSSLIAGAQTAQTNNSKQMPPATQSQSPGHSSGVPANPKMAGQSVHQGSFSNANLNYKIIDAPNHTFGYLLIADGKVIFQQITFEQSPGTQAANQSMPQQMQGFNTREDATRAALLAMDRVRRGDVHPMITPKDLQQPSLVK